MRRFGATILVGSIRPGPWGNGVFRQVLVRRTRFVAATVVTGVVASLVALGLSPVAADAAGPATDGSWTVTATPSDVRAVHVALLRTGKVLLIAGLGQQPRQLRGGQLHDVASGTPRPGT